MTIFRKTGGIPMKFVIEFEKIFPPRKYPEVQALRFCQLENTIQCLAPKPYVP